MPKCPAEGCEYTSSEHGVKLHHKRSHGTSLVKSEFTCDYCETTFIEYDCNRAGHQNTFCSPECREEFKRENSDVDWWHVCDFCEDEFRRHPSLIGDKKFCSRDCHYKYIRQNPDWFSWYNGGSSHEYYGPSWKKQRERAIQRDEERCKKCGLTRTEHYEKWGSDLEVHHKKSFFDYEDRKKANKLENLVTLCKPCHSAESD